PKFHVEDPLQRTPSAHRRKPARSRGKDHRLRLEILEDRLPPGDALPGVLGAGAWTAGSFAFLEPESPAAAIALTGGSAPASRPAVPAEDGPINLAPVDASVVAYGGDALAHRDTITLPVGTNMRLGMEGIMTPGLGDPLAEGNPFGATAAPPRPP